MGLLGPSSPDLPLHCLCWVHYQISFYWPISGHFKTVCFPVGFRSSHIFLHVFGHFTAIIAFPHRLLRVCQVSITTSPVIIALFITSLRKISTSLIGIIDCNVFGDLPYDRRSQIAPSSSTLPSSIASHSSLISLRDVILSAIAMSLLSLQLTVDCRSLCLVACGRRQCHPVLHPVCLLIARTGSSLPLLNPDSLLIHVRAVLDHHF